MEDRSLPLRVGVLLGRDEPELGQVAGLHDSGVVVTNRRVLAWRANGVSPGLPLADVDRIQYDRGPTDALLIIPRAAPHVPLVVMVDPTERAAGESFVAAVRHAVMAQARGGAMEVTAEEGEFMGTWSIRFR